MASQSGFIQYVIEQMSDAGSITHRKMFGGDTIYCEGKVVALICNDQLFVKPTEVGRTFIGEVITAPAYPGAKPSFLVGDKIDDKAWITQLIQLTEKALPAPKPKKKRTKN